MSRIEYLKYFELELFSFERIFLKKCYLKNLDFKF
jgi:hypothetical protein